MELESVLEISSPRWSSVNVYECQSVECAFTSPVVIELGKLVMYCMQFVMSVYAVSMVSWCGVVVFLGAMYMLAMVMFLKCFVCCCSPSETYGRKWGDSNFQILTELPVPPQAAGVVGTF